MPRAHSPRNRDPNRADRKCRTLHEDGSECLAALAQARHALCPSHHREYKKLYKAYKDREKYYNNIKTKEKGADSKEKTKMKIVAGKETLELRNTVNHRFFSLSNNNRGHIRWILKIKSEIHNLEQGIADPEVEEPVGSPSPTQNDQTVETSVFQSLLDPAIPMSRLEHLPPDHPVVTLKKFTNAIVTATVEKLYSIAPSLNDSPSGRLPNERDTIIRFTFRELILHKADADVIVRATKTQSIDTFLRESFIDDLEYYVKFFEAFQEGRSDTFRILRDAICDHILEPEPSSTTILGAMINTDDSFRMMNTKGWDILWAEFGDIADWWNLEAFAIQFGDLVAAKTLCIMRRYVTSLDGPKDENERTWFVPDEDPSQECALAMLQRFLAVAKGSSDPIGPPIKIEHGIAKERQTRCYLVGRMDNKDGYAWQLMQELSERVERFQVLVYDREKKNFPRHLVSPPLADTNPWITRFRSGPEKTLHRQPWKVDWTFENVIDDVDSLGDMMGNNMKKGYYEFIIIDRTPGGKFEILDVVADALSKLREYPTFLSLYSHAIRIHIPAEDQPYYFEEISRPQFGHLDLTPSMSPRYVGNRIRCWDIPEAVRDILRTVLLDKSRVISQYESRLISDVAADLESNGVISKILEYEPSNICPIIMPGIDGLDDVYFPYDLGPKEGYAGTGNIFDFDPSNNDLFEFSETYKRAHPNAIFAKGRVDLPYCAWPCPNLKESRFPRLNFSTPEGRMYRWEKLPFDMPLAPHVWQIFVNTEINSKLHFVRIVQSTLVICGKDLDNAAANLETLLVKGKDHGLKFFVPSPTSWTNDIGKLGLESLWEGVRLFL
ncbi:hypothetical protein F4806DRAFT_473720 [Annulohypoxylon nitens]|nr:hypothetical protein F4806DRAFT_473720 [Annulohypoxylon nitens]